MSSLPVLLVLSGEPRPALVSALVAAGVKYRAVSGSEAAQAATWAQLVICTRVPGWQAVITRIHLGGGAAVLWGSLIEPFERKASLPPELEAIEDIPNLLPALARARARIESASQPLHISQTLLERMESAERISRFAQSIATHIDLPQVVEEAMARTRDLCDADGASLLLVDPNTGELCFDTVSGAAIKGIDQLRLKAGQGIAGKVALQTTSRLVANAAEDTDFDPRGDAASGFTTGSIIAVPLLLSGDVLGVLEAVRSTARPAFTPADLIRLEHLAPHITIAVHNAQLTAQMREMQANVLAANADLERRIQVRTRQMYDAKREWERTFDAISEPIALQEGFVIRRANTAYAKQVGLPITDVPGQTCHKILAGRDAPCEGCPLLSGRSGELTGEIPVKGGALFRFSGFWMSSDPSDVRVVVNYRDVTKQRSLEERLRESERLASLGQLASGAAHEINNPLGFLTSNLQNLKYCLEEMRVSTEIAVKALSLMRKGQPTEALLLLEEIESLEGEVIATDGLEMISESMEGARRVADIVRGLRELSRLEVARADPCCVNASVTRIVRAEFGEAPRNVTLDLGASVEAEIPPLHMDQALGHILRNARQAISEQQHVRVRTSQTDSEVVIEIQDEGCGIPPDHLRRVFEPFFSTRGVGKGIGLGLTAAYGIIKRNSGTIDVRSAIGEGTTFRVKLPRASAKEDGSELDPVASQAESAARTGDASDAREVL
jgi:signal transduction histidine kinase/GAF domain-containing protein